LAFRFPRRVGPFFLLGEDMADAEHIDDIHRIPPGVHRSGSMYQEKPRKKKKKKIDIGSANVDSGILNEKQREISRRVIKGTR
jgi:hypothetical protein